MKRKMRLQSNSILFLSNRSLAKAAKEFPESNYDPRPFFKFEIVHQSSKSMARVGRIHTPHGSIDTPNYVPVATNAALKGVDFRYASSQLIFSNTYHLMLQPGTEVIRDAGGIHKFTGRNKPFITDSGGFQVFSLANDLLFGEKHRNPLSELKRNASKPYWDNHDDNIVEISEEGVQFISYRDGSKIALTPENVVDAQKDIGADIILPLDELPAHGISRDALAESVDRSHRWETRSLQRHLENVNNQAMYSIVHGGLDVELRRKSIDYLSSLPFDGYAIGGSLGKTRGVRFSDCVCFVILCMSHFVHDIYESHMVHFGVPFIKKDLDELLQWMMPLFDQGHRYEKPRHLLGIADEESIRNAVPRGLDTLDSCYPTKLGRRGTLLTKDGLLRIKRGKCKTEHGISIDKGCKCRTCQQYDRAYLNHLFTTKGNEYVAVMLGTEHNLHFMDELMTELRLDILSNRL